MRPRAPITLALDGASPTAMAPHPGWSQTLTVQVAPGQHELTATTTTGSTSRSFCVAARGAAPALGEWTQLQGSAEHHGMTAARIAPPLTHLWARSVGGHLRGGGVAVAGGRVFAPVLDLADGRSGGVVAFDAATGATLWERRHGYAVHNTPAVAGDVVIFGEANGLVHGVRAADGESVWTYDLLQGMSSHLGWLYAAPSVVDGTVYIGTQRRFVALDAASGRELWAQDPAPNGYWLGSFSAAGVGSGVVIASFSRGADGLVAWDALDGHELWRIVPYGQTLSMAVNASVIIDGDVAYLGNGETTVYALDLLSPAAPAYADWANKVIANRDTWSYGIVATPALGGGRLIVPTMYGALVAVNPASGAEVWRHRGEPSVIRMVHGVGAGAAPFAASPVITDDTVWVGAADGTLSALDLDTGEAMWSTDLGVPILSAPTPAGEVLFVGTFDGTLHALWHEPAAPVCPDAPGCQPEDEEGGCAIAGGDITDAGWLVLSLLGFVFRRRNKASRDR